jgi:hypothetical protein
MFLGNTNFDYKRRQFEQLPAGFIATGREIEAVTGKLDLPNITDTVRCGLFLQRTGRAGDVNLYKLPDATATSFNVDGVLFYDETNYRFQFTQANFTHTNGDAVTVVRKGDMRVLKNGAIPLNAPVFLIINSSVANETPGMVKATTGANAIQLNNCKWGEVITDTSVGAVTLELAVAQFA